jgi:hypothetical protein
MARARRRRHDLLQRRLSYLGSFHKQNSNISTRGSARIALSTGRRRRACRNRKLPDIRKSDRSERNNDQDRQAA